MEVADPARPSLLRSLPAPVVPPSPAACGQPCQAPDPFYQGDIAFSPDGHLLAATAGRNRVAVWNVTNPARATRIADFAGSSGFIEAVAFAPRSDLLADVSTRGTVTLFRLSGTTRPAVATMKTLPAKRLAVDFCGAGGCPAGYFALGFAPDGRTLTAIVNYTTVGPSGTPVPWWAVRDVVFTWNVTSPRSVTRVASFSHPAPRPGRRRQRRPAGARPRRADGRGRSALRQLRDLPVDAAMTRTAGVRPGRISWLTRFHRRPGDGLGVRRAEVRCACTWRRVVKYDRLIDIAAAHPDLPYELITP